MKTVLLLGGSGSIGSQSIDVILKNPAEFDLIAISLGNRCFILDEILLKFTNLKYVCLKNRNDFERYKNKYPHINFYYGDEGLIKIIDDSNADIIINALIGFVGFLPSIEVLKNDKILLLANKESLVVGGDIINSMLDKGLGKLYPIDSEHVAIAKCLYNGKSKEVDKVFITASGGPFFDKPKKDFDKITLEEALSHPTWSMGKKITIDSSTMMNKCFEIIEAHHLFKLDESKIEPIVDRKSHVHSMVKFKDETTLLQVGPSDMRIPISYALFLGKPQNSDHFEDVEVNTMSKYEFNEMNYDKFPLINYAKYVLKVGGNSGAALNAVNEECVYAFLNRKIKYIDIINIIDKIMKVYQFFDKPNINDLLITDKEVRKLTRSVIENYEH